jgi:hypothetical protein
MAKNVETLFQLLYAKFKASTLACGEGLKVVD